VSITSKSPRAVGLEALKVAEQSLPAYWHRFSPRKFSVPQLFACLALKAFFRTDYRGIVAILQDLPDLARLLGLSVIPHFTTLQKNALRLLDFAPANQLLATTVRRHLGEHPTVELAAIDSTGMEASQVSPYFVRRRSRDQKAENPWQTTTYTRYPKLQAACDCRSHLVLAALPETGPSPDIDRYQVVLWLTLTVSFTRVLLADAGYDSEPNHVFARDGCRVRSIMPATNGRPPLDPARPLKGRYRQQMRLHRDYRYGQRWQIECVFSMIKRRLGAVVLGRSERTRNGDMMLKVLTHNIMILADFCFEVIYRAEVTPF
jgi:hypothetical protein